MVCVGRSGNSWRQWGKRLAREALRSADGPPVSPRPGLRGGGASDGLEYLGPDDRVHSTPVRHFDHERRSPYEEKLAKALQRAGVQGFQRNVWMGKFEIDFLWPRERVAVEVDGYTHLASRQQTADRGKEELLARLGYTLLRFANGEVARQTRRCVREVQAALKASRAWTGRHDR